MKERSPIRQATTIVAMGTACLSLMMQAIYPVVVLLLKDAHWHYSFVLGNILTGSVVVLNFYLMARGVQKSVDMPPEAARRYVQLNHTLRTFLILAVLVVGFVLWSNFGIFHPVALVVPVAFPHVTVLIARARMAGQDQPSPEVSEGGEPEP